MSPARSLNTIRQFVAHIRRLLPTMGAAAVLLGALSGPYATLAPADAAQPSLPPSLERRFEAPIGHRQPTAEDVPGSVLHDEGATTPNQRDIDKKLDICRGC